MENYKNYTVKVELGTYEFNDVGGKNEEDAAETVMGWIAQDILPDLLRHARIEVTVEED